MFPPIPSWEGLHPLVIHFPIALLLAAPVLVLLGMLLPRDGRGVAIAALVLMAIGTGGAWLAIETGEAAAELAERSDEVNAILERHESMAENVRLVFSILTAVFAGLIVTALILGQRMRRWAWVTANAIFLAAYLGGGLLLARTAHEGGRLVHQFGIHSLIGPG